MNGRIYDPKLGRMLQADPFIQSPTNSQSLNRYSYVLNNPLSYTDPSGYFSFSRFVKKWWRVAVAAVVSVVTYGAASTWAAGWALASGYSASAAGFIGAAVGGAAAGFVSGAIITGSLQGALSGAFIGAVTAGIAERFAQYGYGRSTVHGITEKLRPSSNTVEHLYGSGGSVQSISTEDYLQAVENGRGKFRKGQLSQIEESFSESKLLVSRKIHALESSGSASRAESRSLIDLFGEDTLETRNIVLRHSKSVLKEMNAFYSSQFVQANGFCGNAIACVYGTNKYIFLEDAFFNSEFLAASNSTQASVIAHEFSHLANSVHTSRWASSLIGARAIARSSVEAARSDALNYEMYWLGAH